MANEEVESQSQIAGINKKKRSRRRRKPRSAKSSQVQPVEKVHRGAKKHHDAPMTKRDLYFALHCELVSIGHGAPAVARVTMINWDAEVILDTFVQVPVPVTDFRRTEIPPDAISTHNPQAMSFAKVRQSVHQILKGKILVGYGLQEHLTALGLTHPPTDVRDAAKFQFFQYEEIDGVSEERVSVKRSLADLAAEFLQRDINVRNPMDACIVALDLYKEHRTEWEAHLVELAHVDENRNYFAANASMPQVFSSHTSPFESHPRLPSYDESVPSYGLPVVHPPQERSSWFSLGRSRQSYPSQESHAAQSMLTPEALEALNYSRYGDMAAYGRHHPYYGHPATVHASSSSNPGSSSYYEDSSLMSDSYASESVASSLPDEGQQVYTQPVQQASSSSSWFRFGPRRTRYPETMPKEPMTSLTEEPVDDPPPGWLEHPNVAVERNDKAVLATDEQENDEPDGPNSNEDEKASSSWFSFRRPKSPKPGKTQDDSGDERASTPNRRRRGKAGKGEDSGDERATTPSRRRRASLDSMCISDSIRSASRQSSTGSVGRRNSLEHESSPTELEEPEKQPSSWFSFRRSSKATVATKSRTVLGKEEASECNEQPRLQAEPTEPVEEDWMHEVVGSPSTQEKDLLAVSWDSESIGLEAPVIAPEASRPSTAKESKWLPRFLRSTKVTMGDSTARGDSTEPSSRDQWLNQSLTLPPFDQPKLLNPSFFSREGGMVGSPAFSDVDEVVFFPRSRLETESTLPTVASEAEDEGSGSPLNDSAQDFVHGTEENFAYLNL